MKQGVVYFMKPIGMSGPIKIGFTSNPSARLAELSAQSPFPLVLLAAVPGTRDTEACVQDFFMDEHSHAEWFSASRRLLGFIQYLKAGAQISDMLDMSATPSSINKLKRAAAIYRDGFDRPDADEFLTRVDAWMREHGVSQVRLGEFLGISQSTISHWFRRKHVPGVPTQRLIEKFMAEHSGERA